MEGRNFQVMKSDERDSSWCSRGKGGGRGKLKRLRRLPPTFNCGALLNSHPGNLWLVIIDSRIVVTWNNCRQGGFYENVQSSLTSIVQFVACNPLCKSHIIHLLR